MIVQGSRHVRLEPGERRVSHEGGFRVASACRNGAGRDPHAASGSCPDLDRKHGRPCGGKRSGSSVPPGLPRTDRHRRNAWKSVGPRMDSAMSGFVHAAANRDAKAMKALFTRKAIRGVKGLDGVVLAPEMFTLESAAPLRRLAFVLGLEGLYGQGVWVQESTDPATPPLYFTAVFVPRVLSYSSCSGVGHVRAGIRGHQAAGLLLDQTTARSLVLFDPAHGWVAEPTNGAALVDGPVR